MFRTELFQAGPRSDGSKGGRRVFARVLIFKVLLLQAMHALSDVRCEYLIRDRLSFMRFLGLGLADPAPDANTIWIFREVLKQRNTEAERAAIKTEQVPQGWTEKPAKLRQKDRDARWTVKFSKAKPRQDGTPQIDIAVPAFGDKNHISINRRHGLIRRWTTTDAAAHGGARLMAMLDT